MTSLDHCYLTLFAMAPVKSFIIKSCRQKININLMFLQISLLFLAINAAGSVPQANISANTINIIFYIHLTKIRITNKFSEVK